MPSTSSNGRYIWATAFAVLAGLGLWYMRIEPPLHNVPLDFMDFMGAGKLADGTPIRTKYTGIAAIDGVLPWLVLSFAAGPLEFDPAVRLQQIHFLVQFFSVISIWNIEAYRKRNKWKIIAFPCLWAIFYQTIAGAAIVSLYYFAWVISPASDRTSRGLEVPAHNAKAILVSVVLFYLLPTVAMYIPFKDDYLTQGLVALWQVTPALVSGGIIVLSSFFSIAASGQPSSRRHLNYTYLLAFIVSTACHMFVVHGCLTSDDPRVSFYRVFVPNKGEWKDSLTAGLHFIFQVDWWGVFVSTLLWSCFAIVDLRRQIGARDGGLGSAVKVGLLVSGISVLSGPGGAVALIWWWKENVEHGHAKKHRTK